MIHDCPAGAAAGWTHFVKTFLPALRDMVRHYGANDGALERLPEKLRQAGPALWVSEGLIGERDFLTRLRGLVLDAAAPQPDAALTLEAMAEAFEPLTLVERQVVWLDTMRYDAGAAAVLMRISPESSGAIRERAEELLRLKLDSWSKGMLRRNGAALQEAARAEAPEHPLGVREFLDIIDGRATWSYRRDLEMRLAASWYEIDHFCRLREADHLLRAAKPLSEEESAAWLMKFGVEPRRPPLWKRFLP